MDNAREMLMMMNLQTLQQADKLQETAEVLESRTRELEERSRRDGLTGLYNRAYLDQKLSHEFSMASERDWPMIVMFVDLDHFKQVNDTYGHQAGDQVLQRAARTLAQGTRDEDIVARYGGEEFVIVSPGHGEKTAHIMANRLVESFRALKHPVNEGKEINVTVSVGLAILGEDDNFSSVDEMLEAADKALYVAKKSGRDRYIFYHEDMDNDTSMNGTAVPAA
jgi:diguanylate cyclase (GGDEF)-like protein